MNKGFASGFIASDIKQETINTKNGAMMKAKFSIALSRRSSEGGADFPYFEVFGKNAENIAKYFHKGKGIYVEYHIQTGKYTNKDGKTIFTESKVVDSFEFPPVRKDEESAQDTHTETSEQQSQQTAPQDFVDSIPDDIMDEASLPFK